VADFLAEGKGLELRSLTEFLCGGVWLSGSAVDAEAGIARGEGIAEWRKRIPNDDDSSIFSFTSDNSFSVKLFKYEQ